MKLLMPFWNLHILPRYMPQFTALATHTGQLTILYTEGTPIQHPNIRYRRIELPKGLTKQHSMLRLMDTVHTHAADIPFDAVYCLSGRWLQRAGVNISKKTRTPLVLRLRGDEERVAKYQSRKTLRNLFFKHGIHESFQHASLIIPIAEKLAKVARRHNVPPQKITAPIPNGVDHTKFKPTPQPDNLTIGYIGRISKEKGSDFLDSLVHSTPQTHYLIAGSIQYPFNPPLNCDLIGPVPYSRVQEVYQESSLVIIPSLIEGDPNARLEAYATARPIMITPGAHPEEAKLHGWLLPQGDGWAQVINHLRKKRLETLGKAAHEYSKQFTWERHGTRMAAAISTIQTGETVSEIEIEQEIKH